MPPPRSSPARVLLDMDAFSRFDLLALNALDIPQIVRTTRAWDRSMSRAVEQKAETLLRRVVEDTEKPGNVAQLVHELVRISYRSGLDPASTASWAERATASWSGLFFESRDPGGRRTARLADRLAWAARGESEPPAPGPLSRVWNRAAREDDSSSLAGAPEQKVLMLESVQALVDDLVERPLTDGAQVPLPRLSELGQDRGPRELNAIFSQLFPSDEDGSFVIADPRRYPGEPRVTLRRPDDSRPASMGMFTIVVEPAVSAQHAASGPAATLGRDPARMWEDPTVGPPDWATVVAALQAAGARLSPPPPGDYRRLPGYKALRRWVVDDPSAGPLFDAVRWKDRPLGLLLLARLISQKTWAPKVSTDAEYLEAELNDLTTGDPERSPPNGIWPVRPGWVVRTTAPTPGSVAYVLESTPSS